MLIREPRPAIAHALRCSRLGPVVDIGGGASRLQLAPPPSAELSIHHVLATSIDASRGQAGALCADPYQCRV